MGSYLCRWAHHIKLWVLFSPTFFYQYYLIIFKFIFGALNWENLKSCLPKMFFRTIRIYFFFFTCCTTKILVTTRFIEDFDLALRIFKLFSTKHGPELETSQPVLKYLELLHKFFRFRKLDISRIKKDSVWKYRCWIFNSVLIMST